MKSRLAAEKLLAKNEVATAVDARSRMARAVTGIDPKKILAYVDSAEMDVACLQLIDCLRSERIRESIELAIHEADMVHAKYAKALHESITMEKTVFADIETINQIARCYLELRDRLLDRLSEMDKDLANRVRRITMTSGLQSTSDVITLFGSAGSNPADSESRFELECYMQLEGSASSYSITNPQVLLELAKALEGRTARAAGAGV